MEALFFGLSGGMILLILLVMIGPVIVWFWALIDCIKSDFQDYKKLLWVIIIFILPFFGAVAYLAFGRGQKV